MKEQNILVEFSLQNFKIVYLISKDTCSECFNYISWFGIYWNINYELREMYNTFNTDLILFLKRCGTAAINKSMFIYNLKSKKLIE